MAGFPSTNLDDPFLSVNSLLMYANSKSVIRNICAVANDKVTPKKKFALADPEYIHKCQTVGPRADVMMKAQATINFCCITGINNKNIFSKPVY